MRQPIFSVGDQVSDLLCNGTITMIVDLDGAPVYRFAFRVWPEDPERVEWRAEDQLFTPEQRLGWSRRINRSAEEGAAYIHRILEDRRLARTLARLDAEEAA